MNRAHRRLDCAYGEQTRLPARSHLNLPSRLVNKSLASSYPAKTASGVRNLQRATSKEHKHRNLLDTWHSILTDE